MKLLKTPIRSSGLSVRVRLAIGATLTAAALAVAGATDPQASKLYEDALQRFEKKDHAGAIVQLKNALQIDKNLLPAHLLIGKALLANGDMTAAEAAFDEALRLGVNRSEVVLPLARAVVEQAKPHLILEQARFSDRGLPADIRYRLLLLKARASAETGDRKGGLTLIEDARALEPSNPESWLAEVPIRVRNGQLQDAQVVAEKALSLRPSDPEALYIRGTVAHVRGDLKVALTYYDKAIASNRDHIEGLVSRAGLLIDLNRIEDAKRDIDKLRSIAEDDPRAAYLGALVAERGGRRTEARAALAEVVGLLDRAPIEMLRFKPQLLMLGGLSHIGLDQHEKAKPYLDAVVREQPGSPAAKLLARVHLGAKNIDSAIEVLDVYLRKQPGDTQALVLLASAHMAQGRHGRAVSLLQDAIQQKDDPALRSALGFSLMKGGKYISAVPELEAALRKDPSQVQAGTALASTYLQIGQVKKAVQVAEMMDKRKPDQPGLLFLLGTTRSAAGDLKGARQSLERAQKLDPAFLAPQIELAKLDAKEGAIERAKARLDAVVTKNERHVEALTLLGQLAVRQGRVEEAQRWFEKAEHHAAPDDIGPGLRLVEFHLSNRHDDATKVALQRLTLKAPDALPVLIMQARVELVAGDRGAARTTLTRASGLAAYDPATLAQIAAMQLTAGHAAGAGHSADKALAESPSLLGAQVIRTAADIELRDFNAAEQRARQIVAAHPKLGAGYALMGDVATARGQRPAAVDWYRRAHQAELNSTSALRVFAAMWPDDPATAFRFAEQWLKTQPSDNAVRRVVADAYAAKGNLSASRASYEALLKRAPDDAEALNNLANVLLLSGDASALSVAERALKLKPSAPHILGTAGWAAFKGGQSDRALQLLRDARLRNPSNAETRYFLGVVLNSVGRKAEAREELEAALRTGTPFASAKQAEALLQTLR